MASTYSTDLSLELVATGEKAGLWGTITNTNLQILQASSSGVVDVPMSTGSDVTLSLADGSAAANGKNIYLKLTGTMAGNNSLIIPASTTGGTATRVYIIQDATDRTTANKYTLSVKTAGSSNPIAVPVGATMVVHSNGTDARLDVLQEGNFEITSTSITAYTAVAGDNLLIDTASTGVTITLPASPSKGDTVSIMDVSATGGFGSNNVTVNRNGQPIRGAASNLTLNNNNQSIKLRYTNATKGWQYVYNVTS
jgi:hypothetical protein